MVSLLYEDPGDGGHEGDMTLREQRIPHEYLGAVDRGKEEKEEERMHGTDNGCQFLSFDVASYKKTNDVPALLYLRIAEDSIL